MFAVSDFREGSQMVALLADSRRAGLDFDQAWDLAITEVRRGRTRKNERWLIIVTALRHHRDAWRRAYYREQPTTLDNAGALLRTAMEAMYDDSDFAEPQFISMPEAA